MDKKANITVMVTTNYDQFKKLLGNRDVTNARISAIKESILRVGYQPSPIIVNENKEIIDGQGRLAALKALNLPVLYIEKPGLGIQDCISMNIKMKNWSDTDYIKSYASRGNESYVELCKMMKEFPELTWKHLLTIQGKAPGGGIISDAVRNGTLKFKPFTMNQYERARWVSAMVPAIRNSVLNNQKAIEVLIRLDRYKLIDRTRMLESVNNYAETLKRGASRSGDTLYALNDLYNYNRRSKKYFSDDYKRIAVMMSSSSKSKDFN